MKRKFTLTILILMLILSLTLCFVACDQDSGEEKKVVENKVVAIEVQGPVKIDINDFDFSQYVMVVTYTNGTKETLPLNEDYIPASSLIKLQDMGYQDRVNLTLEVIYKDFTGQWYIALTQNLTKHTVTWKNWDGTVLKTEELAEGITPSYSGVTPLKQTTVDYKYNFKGWSPEITPLQGDAEYTAQFDNVFINYTVIWKNWDGTVLETDLHVEGDKVHEFNKSNPTRKADAQYSYSFDKWESVDSTAQNTFEYVAKYTQTVNKYTVRFLDYDDTVLQEEILEYGSAVEYKGENPTRPKENITNYTFEGWDKLISIVKKNIDYNAVYSSKTIINVSYELDNGTSDTKTFESKTLIDREVDSTDFAFDLKKAEKSFKGWKYNGQRIYDQNGNKLREFKMASTMRFDALFTNNVYFTLIQNIEEAGTITKAEGEYKANYGEIALTATVKAGYAFLGWYDGDTLLTDDFNYTVDLQDKDITLTAMYKAYTFTVTTSSFDARYATVSLNGSEATTTISDVLNHNTEVTLTTTSTIEDAPFLGWYEGNNLLSNKKSYKFTINNKSYDIVAKWGVYGINYVLNGGINSENNLTYYFIGEDQIIEDATHSDYTFIGWCTKDYYSKDDLVSVINDTKDYTLYALFADGSKGFTYEKKTEGYEITGYEGTDVNVVIPSKINNDNVFKIDSVFRGNTIINSVTWPSIITIISDNTFDGCTSLTSVSLPNTITSIGAYSFKGCESLTEFEIQSSVLNLGKSAFENCKSLTSFIIPKTVTSIGDNLLDGCDKLERLEVYGGGKISSNKFVGINETLKHLVLGVSVDDYVFKKSNLESVTVKDGCQSLGYESFSNTSKLNTVTVDASDVSILGGAFRGSNVKTVDLKGVVEMGTYVFYQDVGLQSFTISNSTADIPEYAFTGSSLKTVSIGEGIKIIDQSAFAYCSSLETVSIPNSITKIASQAFYSCTKLKTLTFASGANTNNFTISKEAFSNCTELSSVEFPIHTYAIGTKSFYNDTALQSVSIPDSCSLIEEYAFNLCGKLTSLTFYKGLDSDSNMRIGNYTFASSGVVTINLPETLQNIGYNAFDGCVALTEVSIPNSILKIDSNAFKDCINLNGVTFASGSNTKSFEIGSNAFSGDTSIKTIALPKHAKVISGYAFEGCSKLETLTMPDSIETIRIKAFINCTNLSSVTVTDGVENKGSLSIDSYAFYDNKALKTIDLPKNLSSIGERAFEGCTAIKTITIPDTCKTIADCAFYHCDSLETLNFVTTGGTPSGLSIGKKVFWFTALKSSIVFPDSLKAIGDSVFYDIKNISAVTIPDSCENIGNKAFYGCTNLKTLTFVTTGKASSGLSIGESAFQNTSIDSEIVFPNSLKAIGPAAFYYLNITAITIPDSCEEIGAYAFKYCFKLITLTFKTTENPSSGLSIGKSAFEDARINNSVVFPNNLKTIGEDSFRSCTWIPSITIPSSCTEIGAYAFGYDEGITSLTFTDTGSTSSMNIGNKAFYWCDSITSVTLPSNIKIIESYAFASCGNLTSLSIADSKNTYDLEIQYSSLDVRGTTVKGGTNIIGDYNSYYFTAEKIVVTKLA